MDIDLKALFKQEPSLLMEPIDCDLICQRIEEYVRLKNKLYLEGLNVTLEGDKVSIDVNLDLLNKITGKANADKMIQNNQVGPFIRKESTSKCVFCGNISNYWKYVSCFDDMRTYCSDCKESFQKDQTTKEI